MLKVEKELLEAQTSREVAQMRQMELQYYVDHIGGIQTMATLLAGFAFTAFATMDGGFDLMSFLFKQYSGAYKIDGLNALNATEVNVEPVEESYGPVRIVGFVMEVFEVAAVTTTLGEMLYVMIETMIARLLGSRLALRGPDGSIAIATRHLAAALVNSTKHFIYGLQFFLLSVLCHAFRGLHLVSSIIVLIIIIKYWKSQFVTVGRLAKRFELKEATRTDFDEAGPSCAPAGDENSAPASSVPLWKTKVRPGKARKGRVPPPSPRGRGRRRSLVSDAAHEVKEAQKKTRDFFNPLRDLNELFNQVDDTEEGNSRRGRGWATQALSKPTSAARKLIMREQRREERGAQKQKNAALAAAAAPSPGKQTRAGRLSMRNVAGNLRRIASRTPRDGRVRQVTILTSSRTDEAPSASVQAPAPTRREESGLEVDLPVSDEERKPGFRWSEVGRMAERIAESATRGAGGQGPDPPFRWPSVLMRWESALWPKDDLHALQRSRSDPGMAPRAAPARADENV